MRQWRVGTLSMGLLLVCTGLGLLYAQFNQLAVVDFSLKWWPVIFVLLGIEVLLQNYLKKDDNSKIKYDIFSVIIILMIVLTGLGLQTVNELGLVKHARDMISSQNFTIENSTEITLEPGIQKIVLETGGNQVALKSSPSNLLLTHSTFHIGAQSKNEAQTIASQYAQISQQRAGNTLYLRLPQNQGSELIYGCHYSLVLPDKVAVEVEGDDGRLNINLASIQNDWQVMGASACSIKLPAQSDLLINALVSNEAALQGNLTWAKLGISPGAASQPGNPEENMGQQVQAQAKLGNGTHKMNILNVNKITINHLP